MDLRKKAGVAILISNKIDFKLKSIKRGKEGNFMLATGKIIKRKISILNIYAPNTRTLSYVKETLPMLKSHTNSGRLQHPSLTTEQVCQTET